MQIIIRKLLATILCVVLALVQYLPAYAAPAEQSPTRVLLCTNAGLQWVIVDQEPEPTSHHGSCPWCRLDDNGFGTTDIVLVPDDSDGDFPAVDTFADVNHAYGSAADFADLGALYFDLSFFTSGQFLFTGSHADCLLFPVACLEAQPCHPRAPPTALI